jgi:hypothetical protein
MKLVPPGCEKRPKNVAKKRPKNVAKKRPKNIAKTFQFIKY